MATVLRNNMYIVAEISCVVIFLASSLVAVDDVNFMDNIPHRTSDDLYLDPCKATGFWGDIALTDEDYRATKKMLLKQMATSKYSNHTRSLFEHQVEGQALFSNDEPDYNNDVSEYRQQLKKDRDYLKEVLREKMIILRTPCDLIDKKQCRKQKILLREEIQKTRIKLGKLRSELRRTRKHRRKFQDADRYKYSSDNSQDELNDRYEPTDDTTNLGWTLGQDAEFEAKSRHRRAATSRREILWDYGVIPFMIEANFSGSTKALFKIAMRHWERNTCITFKDKEPEDRNYILFSIRPCGCCSHVGKKGSSVQTVSIGENCDKFGIVIHELGHAIGFWHEHTRPDRDDHVEIIDDHITKGEEYNFKKFEASEIDSLGEPYDYASIMHYSRNKFAKNVYLDTIKPHVLPNSAVRPQIGQRVRLSPGDITQTNKLYQCPSCGKTLLDPDSKFSHTPTEGTPELCQWRISVAHGETIALNLTRLEIPMADNCEQDYLEVRDGHYVLSPLLGRFCGDQLPDTLASTGSRMWIEYKTLDGGGKGFDARYEAVCGGEIMQESGFLESPGYPDDYSANKECEWTITVNEGFTVAFKFDTFELEDDDECDYDYLEVRDGQNETSPLIGKYCGIALPKDIQSTGHHLYMKFISDAWGQKGGFLASFLQEHDECQGDSSGCEHWCVNTIGSYRCTCKIGYELHSDGKRCDKACGGHIDEKRGTITSPSFPDLYPPDKKCLWRIVAPEDKNIKIRFRHFDLEGARRGCPYDTLRISSGNGSNVELHGVYCGYEPPELIISKGNTLIIEFSSDGTVQKTGFRATYRMGRYKIGKRHVRKRKALKYRRTA